MAVNKTIEERLTAVEEAIAELRDQRVIQPPAPDWLEQVVGSFWRRDCVRGGARIRSARDPEG